MNLATDRKANPTNFIGDRLRMELADYGLNQADLARVLGLTGNGTVGKWLTNRNGITFPLAERVALVLGCTLDELSNTGKFTKPVRPTRMDKEEAAQEILNVIDAGGVRNAAPEFIVDVRRRCHRALAEINGMSSTAKAKPNYSGPTSSCDARPFAKANPEPQPKKALSVKDAVAEVKLRAKHLAKHHNVKWGVDENGELTAQRVVVEDL